MFCLYENYFSTRSDRFTTIIRFYINAVGMCMVKMKVLNDNIALFKNVLDS